MIPDDKAARLWGLLERSFNMAVCSIERGMDENHQPCADVVHLPDDKLDLRLLPDRFEGENIRYRPYVRKALPL